jgi:hypothetical protein
LFLFIRSSEGVGRLVSLVLSSTNAREHALCGVTLGDFFRELLSFGIGPRQPLRQAAAPPAMSSNTGILWCFFKSACFTGRREPR